MKKLLYILVILLSTSVHAKKVKFACDMTGTILNPTGAGMHVAGDFQTLAGFPGGDWSSNTTPLTQEGITNIYSIVVDIPAFAKYEYKFINGDQFYEAEFVPEPSRVGYNFNDNRWIYVDSLADDTTFVGAILFGGNAPTGLYLLRTIVDMSNAGSVSSSGVHVAGNWQTWNTAADILYSFGSNVYEKINYVVAGSVEYKFYNGNTAGDAETVPGPCSSNSNRYLTVSADTVLPVVCYGSCTACVQSVTESMLDRFSIYPNPSSNDVMIQFANADHSRTISVLDASGREVRKYSGIENSVLVEKANLENGLYIINVISEGRITASGKLIFQ